MYAIQHEGVNDMETFLIDYIGFNGSRAWDIQRAATLLDAVCAHKRLFPHSFAIRVRSLGA